ncbi:MAG TPA: mechanosensitive ion channel domain-containing protein [Terriglobia bacterium]|nr:mechanosensitive ion channel domain-containing protein [Terriglobia bacterium]
MFSRGWGRLVLLTLLLVPGLHAQVPGVWQQATPARQEAADDPLGRSTPHGTVLGFIRAAGSGDYEQAASYLDTKQRGELAQKLAQQLQVILDRETSIDLGKLSRQPDGGLAGTQSPNRYLLCVASTSSGKVEINLDRVQRGENPPIWLFSQATLRLVPEIYENLGENSEIERHLPGWLNVTFLLVPIWKWCAGFISIPLTLLLGSWIGRLLRPLLQTLAGRASWDTQVDHAQRLVVPLRLVLFGILFLINASFSYALMARSVWHRMGTLLIILGVTWLAMRVVGIVSGLTLARLKRMQSSERIALAGLLGRLGQIAAFAIGVLVVLYTVGVNLTAALTGLGIGGLAVAFAAQKTLENLFGGIMIISDRPVRIGDACKVGDVSGNVVDIGLRSTRIRTPDRTIMTIPNGQLATMNVENYTLRDKFWFHPTIALSRQTTVDQMQTVLSEIRELFDKHPNVESETARVRFISIGKESQDVEIYAYVFAPDYNAFLATQEELLLKVLGIVESAGTALALPTQVTHIVQQSDGTAPRPKEPKEEVAARASDHRAATT